MEYVILIIIGVIAGFFGKNWIRDGLISEHEQKDQNLQNKQVSVETEIKDLKKNIEETKKTEEGRTPDKVEEYWSKK
jgi:peptidoglycan hydrolase CwlO-like protein